MNKLLELRKEKGVRQIDIANMLKVSKQCYSNYENGESQTLTPYKNYRNILEFRLITSWEILTFGRFFREKHHSRTEKKPCSPFLSVFHRSNRLLFWR